MNDAQSSKESGIGFSRKVQIAIGTLVGTLTTAIGLTAVFFPDLFNLQKNRMPELQIEITSLEDAETLSAFMERNPKKIVKLDISVCSTLQTRCSAIRHEGNSLEFSDFPKDEDCPADDQRMMYGGTQFHFRDVDESDTKGQEAWLWDKFAHCKSGAADGVMRTSGYFLTPESAGFGQGWLVWMLSPVPERDVLLKDY